ncbi:MAG: VCBS repeat-containing protein [bacterium]|nr:VCBS repeat-containing protein [bacterium]
MGTPSAQTSQSGEVEVLRCIVGFFLALTIVASSLWAVEIPFNDKETIVSGFDGTARLALGDLDGNGTLDVTIVGFDAGEARHFSNDGNGSWTETIVASGLHSPWSVRVGDIDGDGDGDILVGQRSDDPANAEIIWYENPTNGINPSWVAHPVVAASFFNSRGLALADMNRDGHLDVVYIGDNSSGDCWVEWIENDGSPDDGWGTSYSISTSPDDANSLAVSDMDADGDLDVVITDKGLNQVVWYENDGAPDWDEHLIDVVLGGTRAAAVGDIDGDGVVDVVVAEMDDSEVSWYGRGSGGTWVQTTVTTSLAGAMDVVLVDMDMDGDFDILAAGWTSNAMSWYDNTSGDGSSWTQRTVDGSFDGAGGLAAGDVDGDGDPDVFASSFHDGIAVFWRNRTCHRSFSNESRQDVWLSPVDDPRAVAVADLNGDGKQDVITGTWDGNEITAYLNDDAEAGVWVQNPVATGFERARDVAVADMDGDGDLDVLGAAVGGDAIRWWENLGPTTPILFNAHDIVTSYDGAHRVEAADFDRDGDMDVIVCAYDADDWSWVENVDGVGTSWTQRSAPSLDAAFDLAVGDLNFDGTLDVVVTAYLDDAIMVGLNHMPGPDDWQAFTVADPVDGPRGVDLGDFDGDGDLDIVAVLREANAILWFENDGTGENWTQHDVGTGTFPNGVAVRAADMDGDGDVDVVATNQDERDVKIWLNLGSGIDWGWRSIEAMLDNTWDLDVADINNDGMMDVVVAAGDGADRLVWYGNVGAQYGEFKPHVAPETIIDGDSVELLTIIQFHYGRAGRDADMEPSLITVDFADAAGAPLASSQINTLLERLDLYVETNGSRRWQPTDDLVDTLTDINLTAGTLTWILPDGAAQLAVAPSAAATFYIVATAQTGVLGQFEASIAAHGVVVEDADFDLPLISRRNSPVTTGIVTVGGLIFRDSFESGDCSQWSSVTGG